MANTLKSERTLNDKKIAFIMCANNDLYVEEAMFYLNRLQVPDGYEVEQLVVRDAKSMASGYNEAMYSSDAKYKIYIHQDVFLTSKYCLVELLDVFKDPYIGIVGVVGGETVPQNATFAASWDTRCTYVCNTICTSLFFDGFEQEETFKEASALDGMFLATQYDIEWDETYDGWDFYDITQSIRFKENGYKVVVARGIKDRSWCIHDEGFCVPRHYDVYRQKFCEYYNHYGFNYDGDSKERTAAINVFDSEKNKCIKLGLKEAGDIDVKNDMLNQLSDCRVADSELSYWRQVMEMHTIDMQNGRYSPFWPASNLDESMQIYYMLKFMMWRMELGCEYEEYGILFEWLRERMISVGALSVVVKNVAFDPKGCWAKISETVKDI